MNQYRKHANQIVNAVQLNLKTDGFAYEKWGNVQHCNAGDWLVDNDGDCYTVSAASFAETYTKVATGQYVKTAPVWAVQTSESGKVKTKEGFTGYGTGDYLVSNNQDGTDSYAVSKAKFEAMYERVDAGIQ